MYVEHSSVGRDSHRFSQNKLFWTEKWPIKLQPELDAVSNQLNAWSWII
jgi:hypothetical protein